MADDTPKEPYSVEEPEPDAAPPDATPSPAAPAESARTDDIDAATCPECGAALDPGDGICIRCGLPPDEDRSGGEPTAKERREPRTEADEAGKPISPTGQSPAFDFWLPAVLGAAALLLLVIGHLAGAPGLFPQARLEEIAAVPWAMRFAELLRTLVLLMFWTGCGVAGLFGLSFMFERPLGEARVATLRMASIMATIRLAGFIAVPGPRWVEWMAESILYAVGFILLSMLLYRLAPRNAGLLALWTLVTIFVLWLFTFAVQWALGG